jgi:hypothetical protein
MAMKTAITAISWTISIVPGIGFLKKKRVSTFAMTNNIIIAMEADDIQLNTFTRRWILFSKAMNNLPVFMPKSFSQTKMLDSVITA